MSVRAADAGWLLQSLARGGAIDLGPEQDVLLATLRDLGLVRAAADPGPERERLAQLRAELDGLAGTWGSTSAAQRAERERALRSAILDVSERIAETEGATEVRSAGAGGPYRGAAIASSSRWQVTQAGRAMLSDLAPRMLRVGSLTLEGFASDMHALRVAIAWRADRAAQIDRALAASDGAALGAARRSVAIGLAAARAEPDAIASAFSFAFRELRALGTIFTSAQDAAAAECLCLVHLLDARRHGATAPLRELRQRILTDVVAGRTEDALDAAVMLLQLRPEMHARRVEIATELARELQARGREIGLPLALLATIGDEELAPHVAGAIDAAARSLAAELGTDAERVPVATLLAFARGDLAAQIERWRVLRQYLARFAPDGMAIAAALLSWVDLEPAEILDDLRLASAEIQKHRLADGGAETMSLAIKLLISVAMLAAGSEGDHEEKLALAPVIVPRAPHLGLHGALATMPLVTTALAAFHRPVLDAALEYERAHQSTHSAYVFGGGRSVGWG